MKNKKVYKKTTMADVAKRAGVTIGTVSHVINNTAPISEKTKANVYKAIKELNYTINTMARGLRKQESNMIGLIVPDITNEYYSSIARSFTELAYENKYTVMLSSFQYNLEREKLQLDVLVDKRVDAIVILGGSNEDEEMLQQVTQHGIPIILGDRQPIGVKYPVVEFNNKATVKALIKILHEKGYKRIGYVSEKIELTNLEDRYNGYLEGMKELELPISKDFIFIEESLQLNKIKNGYDFTLNLLETRKKPALPDVFITTSDLVALGMVSALKSKGYKIPEDFGLVGFDDLSMSAYIEPSLTTVLQDPNQISHATWDMVLHALKKEAYYTPHLILEQKLILRTSI